MSCHVEYVSTTNHASGLPVESGGPIWSESVASSGVSINSARYSGYIVVTSDEDGYVGIGLTPNAALDPRHRMKANAVRRFSIKQGERVSYFSPSIAGGTGTLPPTPPVGKYVATDGVDQVANGTYVAPYRTLEYAFSQAVAGDTIYLRGGTYKKATTGIYLAGKNGTSSQPITIKSYSGERAILDGSLLTASDDGGSNAGGWVIKFNGVSWINFEDIDIANGRWGGLLIRGAAGNCNFRRLNSYNNGWGTGCYEGKGIGAYQSGPNILLEDIDSFNNVSDTHSDADGFQLAPQPGGTGMIVRRCRAYYNDDDGYDMFNVIDNTIGEFILFEECDAWGNGYKYGTTTATGGDGNGFKLGGTRGATTGTSGGHTLRRCVSFGNAFNGFDDNGSSAGNKLYNNTSYGNAARGFLLNQGSNTGAVQMNNLSVGNVNTTVPVAAGSTDTTNSWNAFGGTANTADFLSIDSSTYMSARVGTSFAKPASDFLQLVAGSDLIDKGTVVSGITYLGTKPDLGAFEKA